jgi:1-acyl-sn-glycerol-3-phosphate acyltransferase
MEKWYRFCQIIGRVLLLPFLIKKEGRLPQEGAVIIVSNHRSYFDSPLLGILLERRVYFLAKKIVFEWFLIGWLIKKSHWALPVSKSLSKSFRGEEAAEILKKGGAIMLFPEGRRNKTDSILLKFDRGFARLAIENKVPVVPIAIIRRWKKFWWLPCGLEIFICPPIPMDSYNTKEDLIGNVRQKMLFLLS